MAIDPNEEKYVTVDGIDYKESDLSDEAKSQMINLRVTDQEITRLNQQLAIYKTARVSYARALDQALPKPSNETTQ